MYRSDQRANFSGHNDDLMKLTNLVRNPYCDHKNRKLIERSD